MTWDGFNSTDQPTIGQALVRQWPLVLLSVVLFGALGILAGSLRNPVYSAEARMSVGRLSLDVQSVPGFAVGGEVVASGYARSIDAPAIVAPAARATDLPPRDVQQQLSATNVPSSSLFDIIATGESEAEAVALANAAAAAMVDYGRRGAASPQRGTRLLEQYRGAVRRRAEARQRVRRLELNGASDALVADARADFEAENLRVSTASDAYRESQRATVTGGVVEALAPALAAESDRGAKMQLFGFAGVLGGLLLGMGLALLRTARRSRHAAA